MNSSESNIASITIDYVNNYEKLKYIYIYYALNITRKKIK